MEERDVYLIPRNLNKPDTIVHKPISLNWKEIAYLGIGIGGIALSLQSSLLPMIKITFVALSGLAGVLGATFRYEGSMIHELILDILIYSVRKISNKKN